MNIILAELETLILNQAKEFLKKQLTATELLAIHTIYKDIKVLLNGGIDNESKKQA